VISSDGTESTFFDPDQVNFLLLAVCRVSHLLFGSRKISSGQVKKYPGQRWVGLLFIVGQEYARVGSGPISSDFTGSTSL